MGIWTGCWGESPPGNRGYREIWVHAWHAGSTNVDSKHADHLEATAAMGSLLGRAWPSGSVKAHAALMDHVGGSTENATR